MYTYVLNYFYMYIYMYLFSCVEREKIVSRETFYVYHMHIQRYIDICTYFQPGLKGPGLYISNSVLFIFDLVSAPPSAVVELVLPRRRRRLPPPGRAILPARIAPHPVSAAAPDPTLRRRGFPRAHRRRTRSLATALSIGCRRRASSICVITCTYVMYHNNSIYVLS